RHEADRALRPHRRVRLVEHAGDGAGAREGGAGRNVPHDAGRRSLSDERKPGKIPRVHPAGARRDPDAAIATATAGEAGGWERNVWALSLCIFIAFVGFQFFSPFLPLYIRELGVTDPSAVALWSGVLAAVTPTVSAMLSPVFGRLADRFGRKMMLIRSLAGFTVIIAAMGLVTSVQQLFVMRFLMGLVAGFTPMAIALASISAPREKASIAIGRVQAAQLLSTAVGPAVGGFAATHLGIRPAFYVTSGMCAIALVALIFLFRESR